MRLVNKGLLLGQILIFLVSCSSTSANAGLSASPSSLNLGSVTVNSTGSATITLTNGGRQSITIQQASTSLPEFTITGPSLPTTVGAGNSAIFQVTFRPDSAKTFSGSLSFILNRTSGGTKTVTVQGTGLASTAPQVGVTPGSETFTANVGSSQSQSVTISSMGTSTLSITNANVSGTGFSISGLTLPLNLPPGQSSKFSVKFAPTAAGSFTGAVSLVSNGTNSPTQVSLTGSSTQTASVTGVTISPTSPSVKTGQTIQFSSSVQGTATDTSVTWTASAGTITSTGLFTAPSTAATVTVTAISNADATKKASTTVTVTALQPQMSVVPASVSFGNVTVGTTNTQTVTVSNPGSANLSISQAAVSGSGFGLSGLSLPLTLSPGASARFTVSFAPTTTTGTTGSLTLISNAATSPTTIALSGTGAAVSVLLEASPTSLSFGNVDVASSDSRTVTLSNTGNSNVSISQLAVSGTAFTASGLTTPQSLAAGQSTTFSVKFAPTAAGTDSGSVSVTSSAANSPTQIALAGTGLQPSVSTGPLPAFPGAQGGGAGTVGGRGGTVCEVTNLNDSGPNSFRDCVTRSGPRTVVFRVGGTVQVLSDIVITNPYITIAGQTAPGGGILLAGTQALTGSNGFRVIFVETHDVVIRYLRIRPGPNQAGGGPTYGTTGIAVMNADIYNVVFDHISTSWTDNKPWIVYSNYGPGIHNLTYQWSMDNEGLAPSASRPYSQSVGGGSGNSNGTFSAYTDIDYHHNFMSNHSHRVTEDARNTGRQVNNIVYNWSYFADQTQGPQSADFIGNLFKAGPLTSGAYKCNGNPCEILIDPGNAPGAPAGNPSIYLFGNKGPNQPLSTGNQWVMANQETGYQTGPAGALPSSWQRSTPLPTQSVPVAADDVNNLENVLLPTVGASQKLSDTACDGSWVSNRDSVDTRLVNEYYAGIGVIPTDPSQVGGYPTIAAGTACTSSLHDGIADQWKINHGLNTTDTTLYQRTATNGYTYLENYLNGTNP